MRLSPCLLALLLLAPRPLPAWGRQGHEIAASLACRDLPPALAPWFQGREAFLREHCNDPDAWKQGDPLEGPRHFLNSDAYGGPDGVPEAVGAAQDRLGLAAFERDGQAPWVIQERVRRLVQAFKAGDPAKVAWESAILCHYVADLNVPLHTTADYNGQSTGQHGVHGRWETGLVQRLGSWDPGPRLASLDGQDLFAPWSWLKQANALVAPLLRDDLEASRPGSREPHWEALDSSYWTEFNRRQGPVVRAQLERSGQRTAQMILLAWEWAGEPSLREI
jgi:hypothetical protein